MAMVDRYKKAGGFIQLLQVMETCGPKKREQLMRVIEEETPKWATAINQKMLSFEKILSWKPEAILEITAQVNFLAFATALKSLNVEDFSSFMSKLGLQEKRKFEQQCSELNPNPNEISACIMKVIYETRILFTNGSLKLDKVDPDLVVPEDFETNLDKGFSLNNKSHIGSELGNGNQVSNSAHQASEVDALRRKVVELTQQLQSLKKDNALMIDKLDKIKKIA